MVNKMCRTIIVILQFDCNIVLQITNMLIERQRIMNGYLYTVDVAATKDTRATKLFTNATGARLVFDIMVKKKIPVQQIMETIVIHHDNGVKPISQLKRVTPLA